ncbi:choice-of-anchor L domain-containing protein [Psychroserpens sp. XS_ASV72]|uniref:T9SS type B sorting domain-containing protein n=1 Tax=Psychroserpens sp. XS_ASV72 TaxID=3241293 RepID=UPI003518F28F
MKNIKWLWIALFFSVVYKLTGQQITTQTSSLEAMIQANFGQGCVEISNVSSSINGQVVGINSYGTFDRADSNFPFTDGVILSTGSIYSSGNTENTSTLNDGSTSWTTDADLETTLGLTGTLNATSIEFDFISATNQIAFNYVLASEEYYSNFPCQYSDGFAFLIKKAGTSDPYTNIALVPGTSTPVNTTSIRQEIVGFCPPENEQYFEGYNIGDTNFNGRTSVLTARASIIPYELYHIKLIIADQTDQNYDSAVLIENTSTIAAVDLGPDIDICAQTTLLNANVQNNTATYQWYLNGTLLPGATNPLFQTSVSGTYSVVVNLQINNSSCTISDEVVVNLSSVQSADIIPDFTLCDDSSNDGVEIFDLSTKDIDALDSVPEGNYNISYHLTSEGALNQTAVINTPYENVSNPQTIYVRIVDTDTGCLAYTSFDLVVNNYPIYDNPPDISLCEDATDENTQIDLTLAEEIILESNPNLTVSFHYTQNQAEMYVNPITGDTFTFLDQISTVYIRVVDNNTGCVGISSIQITILNNPELNPETQWITACETDGDGFEIFDITSVLGDVLQGLNNVTVSYHETQMDAQDNINPIMNPTAYQNITPDFQMVYIRVTDNVTGCTSIAPIELHTNVVLTGFDTTNYGICDDITNDGIADFNLNLVKIAILDNYQGYELSFYETESDRDNNINALNTGIPFTATSIVTTLYVSAIAIDSPSCETYIDIDLVIHPAFELINLDPVEYCDTDFDGLTGIELATFNEYVSTGVDFPNVRYYLTEEDAINNDNQLPPTYFNTTNPLTVYTRVTNSQTSCFDVAALEITVIDPPVVSEPSDIIICDNDQDAISIVDLESRIPEIVTETTDLIFSFHTSFEDANTNDNTITTPNSYSTSTQTIFVRVESLITTCHSIVEFDVIVNTLPVFIPISEFITCESDGDEINDFFFNLKDEEIINGQPGKEALYFETAQDAIDRTNIIDKNSAYQNLSNPQTVYVRIENVTDIDCFGIEPFVISVTQYPTFNPPTDITVCDDSSNDGIDTFDLNGKVTEISNGISENLDISFHLSFEDADANTNEIPLEYTNTVNPQQIYARIENGTVCYSIADFELNIVQVPEANPAPDIVMCDTDYDGLTNFDLTVIETEVLDVRIDDISLSYHESVESADSNSGLIADPENYTNLSNPQTVYLKILNTISNCYSLTPINLSVNLPPPINDFNTYDICENNSSYFDLNEINAVVVDDTSDVILNYFETFTDAQDNNNPLSSDYTYTTTNDTIYTRVESQTTGCFYVYSFQLIVNPWPIANQPDDLQACDDSSNDQITEFNLSLVESAVLGNQNPNVFTFSYHASEAFAEAGVNPLNSTHIGQQDETIYVRVENNTTGCYSLTQFNLIVLEHPEVPTFLANCDSDYDGITTFDLTLAEAELFETINPDNSISYFETIEDLLSDSNAISTPENYTNLFNHQTVFIKVYNSVANCFTYVPLELQAYLPPEIDPLENIEVCETNVNAIDLNDITTELLVQTNNVIVSYYATEIDALNQTNALNSNYAYQTMSDTIFARISFTTTHCFYIHEFTLLVNPIPVANPVNDLITCDDDYDGFYNFDFSIQDSSVLGNQNSNLFSISYHNNITSAIDGIDDLEDSYLASNNETIFIRVESNNSNCYALTAFQTIINPKPEVHIDNQTLCLDDLPLVVSVETYIEGDSYLWSNGETTPEIEITQIGNYSVTVTTPEGCQTTEFFEVSESESASIVVTESIDFSDPNNVIVTVEGIGNYLYQLDDGEPQFSNVFTNVGIGYHTLTIYDQNGCDFITETIVVIDAPKFMTPNNDGHFDTWHITGVENLPGTIIYIFDRYGKLIKTLTSSTPGWNGYYNGNLMPASDYWYIAKIKKGNESFEIKGHFTLRL